MRVNRMMRNMRLGWDECICDGDESYIRDECVRKVEKWMLMDEFVVEMIVKQGLMSSKEWWVCFGDEYDINFCKESAMREECGIRDERVMRDECEDESVMSAWGWMMVQWWMSVKDTYEDDVRGVAAGGKTIYIYIYRYVRTNQGVKLAF